MKKIVVLLFTCTLLLGSSCNDKTAKTELEAFKSKQQVEEQNKLVVKRYWEGKWNDRRPEILDELQTPDVVYHGTSMEMNGIEEYKQVYSMYLSALSETQIIIEKLIAEGDLVVSQAKILGIQNGQLDDIPPTGNKLAVSCFTIFRLVDGKIAEEWEILDDLGMMMQLGLELKMKE